MAAAIKQLVPRTALRRMQRLRGHVPPEVVDPSLLEEAGVRITDRRSGRGSGLRRRVALLKGNPMIAEAMEGIDPIFSRFGVEARHPFYDRRVMEYCLSLPAEQRMKGGWTRSIMRRALRDVLPESVQHRVGKALLGKNTVHNMHEHERESLQRLLGDAVLRPYLPAETAERLYRGFLAQPTGKHANPLLRIAALAAWLHDEAMRFPSNGERHECAKST